MEDKHIINIAEGNPVIKLEDSPHITLPLGVYQELLGYVAHYKTEVSGCGLVVAIEHTIEPVYARDVAKIETEYQIKEVFLPEEQTNSSGSTDIDEKVIHTLINDLIQKDVDVSQLRMHWHSHANMSTFHSMTDTDNYATLKNDAFLVSLVMNRRGHVLGRVDYYKPVHISISGVPVYVFTKQGKDVTAKIKINVGKLDKWVEKKKKIKTTHYCRTGHWDNIKQTWVYDDEDDTTLFNNNNFGGIRNFSNPKRLNLPDNSQCNSQFGTLQAEREQKRGIRNRLGISKKRTKKFENCGRGVCEGCIDYGSCMRYMRELEKEGLLEDVATT